MSVGELIGVAAEQLPVQEEAVQNAKPPAETTNIFGERALQLQTETLHHTIKDKRQLEAEAVESQRQIMQLKVCFADRERQCHSLRESIRAKEAKMAKLNKRNQQSEEDKLTLQQEMKELKV